MTGDLSEPAHGAAQQAYEAAARLYEQAAAELDQAAAHCRVAATHFRGAEVPRGAAHARPPEPAPVVHRAFVKGKLGALVPSGPLTVGRWFAQGRRGPRRAAGWQPGCATSLCRDVFGRGQACSYEPGLQAGDGAVL